MNLQNKNHDLKKEVHTLKTNNETKKEKKKHKEKLVKNHNN